MRYAVSVGRVRREREIVQIQALQNNLAGPRAGGHVPFVNRALRSHAQHLQIRLRPQQGCHLAGVSLEYEGIVEADGGVHLHDVAVDRGEHVTAVVEADGPAVPDGELVHRQQIVDQYGHEAQFVAEADQAEQPHRVQRDAAYLLRVLLQHYHTLGLEVPQSDAAVELAARHEHRLPGAHREIADRPVVQRLTHDAQLLRLRVHVQIRAPQCDVEQLGPARGDDQVIEANVHIDRVDLVQIRSVLLRPRLCRQHVNVPLRVLVLPFLLEENHGPYT